MILIKHKPANGPVLTVSLRFSTVGDAIDWGEKNFTDEAVWWLEDE